MTGRTTTSDAERQRAPTLGPSFDTRPETRVESCERLGPRRLRRAHSLSTLLALDVKGRPEFGNGPTDGVTLGSYLIEGGHDRVALLHRLELGLVEFLEPGAHHGRLGLEPGLIAEAGMVALSTEASQAFTEFVALRLERSDASLDLTTFGFESRHALDELSVFGFSSTQCGRWPDRLERRSRTRESFLDGSDLDQLLAHGHHPTPGSKSCPRTRDRLGRADRSACVTPPRLSRPARRTASPP
nr:hypothetical protein [Acidimicrobium ferrooxidans]